MFCRRSLDRPLNRRLDRRLSRRITHYSTRRLSGSRRSRSYWLSETLRAYARVIRAHKRLIKLAPRIYDPVVVRREAKQREEDEKWQQKWEPILRKVYGDEAADTDPWPKPAADSRLPKNPRTVAAVERLRAELDLWLKIGDHAMETYRQRQPHHLPDFSLIVRLIETAFALGRLACSMPLDGKPTEPDPEPSSHAEFEAALKRIYGPTDGRN